MRLIPLLLILCTLLTACAPFESRFLRVPMRSWTPPERAQVLDIPAAENTIIKAWLFRPTKSTNSEQLPVLIIAHGRSDSMSDYRTLAPELADAIHSAVLVYDYRGFGASSELENPTRQSMIDDADSVLKAVTKRSDIDSKRVVLMGISMGAYPASASFAESPAARALVLWGAPANIHDLIDDGHEELNPFSQLFARLLVPRHRAPEDELALAGTRPVLIAHAQHDEVIHVRHAHTLKEAAPNSILLIDETGSHASISSQALNAIIDWVRSHTQ
jgi:pimeloyl-ACP methyl ester carboxylesterase